MSQRVVDVLEVIEVEEQQGHFLVVPVGAGQHAGQMLQQKRPVGQAGQNVVVHQEVSPLLARS